MANEVLVGILYASEEKKFGKLLDDAIDFEKFGKNQKAWVRLIFKVVEAKDGNIFSWGIMYLDNNFGKKLGVKIKPIAREVALAFINKDLGVFEVNAPALINKLIDIRSVSEETEAIFISALIQGLVEVMGKVLKVK